MTIHRTDHRSVRVLIGTAICTAVVGSALTSDSAIERIGRQEVVEALGPIDVRLTLLGGSEPTRDLGHLEDLVRHTTLEGTDGLLTLTTSDATLVATRSPSTPRAEVSGCAADVDFAAVRHFGPDPMIGGMSTAGSRPGPGEIALGRSAASRLGVGAGDTVELRIEESASDVVVTRILEQVGVAGYCEAFVAPGEIHAAHATAPDSSTPLRSELLLSVRDGIADEGVRAEQVADTVRNVLDGAGFGSVVIDTPKAQILSTVADVHRLVRTLFAAIGSLALAAAVLGLTSRRRSGPDDPDDPDAPRPRRPTSEVGAAIALGALIGIGLSQLIAGRVIAACMPLFDGPGPEEAPAGSLVASLAGAGIGCAIAAAVTIGSGRQGRRARVDAPPL